MEKVYDARVMRERAEQMRKQADALCALAADVDSSPNLPTVLAQKILKEAGFGVIHMDAVDSLCSLLGTLREEELGEGYLESEDAISISRLIEILEAA